VYAVKILQIVKSERKISRKTQNERI